MCYAYRSSWRSYTWGDWHGTFLQKCWLFSSSALSWVCSPVSVLFSLYGHQYWLSSSIHSPWHWSMFLIMYLGGHRSNYVVLFNVFLCMSLNLCWGCNWDLERLEWVQFWIILLVVRRIIIQNKLLLHLSKLILWWFMYVIVFWISSLRNLWYYFEVWNFQILQSDMLSTSHKL